MIVVSAMQKLLRNSLSLKVLAPMFVAGVPLVALVAWAASSLVRADVEQRILRTLARQVAVVDGSLTVETPEAMTPYLTVRAGDTRLRAAVVVSGDPPRVVASSTGSPAPKATAPEIFLQPLAAASDAPFLTRLATDNYLFAAPIGTAGAASRSWVAIKVSRDAVAEQVGYGAMLAATIALLVTLFAMSLAYLLLRRYVVVPLHAIELAMELRLNGQENVYADVLARDEVGQLAVALNAVIEQKLDGQVKYKNVLDTISDGVVVLDADGVVQIANPAAKAMFGFAGDTMIGESFLGLLFGGADEEAGGMHITEFQTHHSRRLGEAAGELIARRRNGRLFPVEIAVTEMKTREGAAFTGVIRDITHQKATQDALEFNNDALRLQATLYACIQRAQDTGTLLESVLPVIAGMREMKAERRVAAFLCGAPGKAPELARSYSGDGSAAWRTAAESIVMRAWEAGAFEDHCPHVCAPGHPHGDAPDWACYLIPLYAGGEVLGVFYAATRPEPRKDELWLSVLQSIGSQLGLALLGQRRKAEVEQARDRAIRLNNDLEAAVRRANEMADTARSASVAKSQFLANMSHEIRTPMNGVMGMLELMYDTELTAEQLDYAGAIKSSAEALLDLINEILDFSKIEAGKVVLESINFDIRNTLDEALELLGARAEEKQLELACLVHAEVPRFVNGDPGRLRQIVLNLLSNAVKFTERGEVTAVVSLEEACGDTVAVRIEIADTGIGIRPEQMGQLFESFTQADESTTRKYGGTGLGLAISRQLTELMGGTIVCTSEPGEGTTFTFSLKFKRAANPDAETAKPPVDLSGMRTLVVDDNQSSRRFLAALLADWGADVVLAEGGQDALRLLEDDAGANPFRLAIVDHRMPDMDGPQVGQAIRALKAGADLPMILLTSMAVRGDARRMEEIGFAGFLPKPVRAERLLECVTVVLGRQEPGAARGGKMVTRHQLQEARRQEKRRILLAEDNLINQKVAVRLLERKGYVCDVVGNGREAVHALESDDYDLVLMDCQMPEMDGFEATAKIRSAERRGGKARIPVVALTANAAQGDRERCLASGMDDYVSKPFEPAHLVEAIERCIAAHPRSRRVVCGGG